MKFKSYKEILESPASDLPLDGNLAIADFEKMHHNLLSHLAFETLDVFRTKHSDSLPRPWNDDDATDFLNIASEIANSSRYTTSGLKPSSQWHVGETLTEWRFLALFCLTASGVFNPLCAF